MSSVFVVGVGPGIGRSVARRFATDGFDVGVLALARSASTVDAVTGELSDVTTASATADVADEPPCAPRWSPSWTVSACRRWWSTTPG